MTPETEGYFRRDITDDPGTLSNGVSPEIQFRLIVWLREGGGQFFFWWDFGYSRPPLIAEYLLR